MATQISAISRRQHLGGLTLVILAIAGLGLLPMLPGRSVASVRLPFLENNPHRVVVAFAGFPGCSTVCPTTLKLLGDVYQSMRPSSDLGITFINIAPATPHDVTHAFATSFHPHYASYTVTFDEAATLYQTLSLVSFANDQLAGPHSGFVYLFVRSNDNWHIEKVFKTPPSADQLKRQLTALELANNKDPGS